MLVEISKLKLNPFHSKFYKINDIEDLVENIKENGLLVKIVVKSDLTIISGVRRYFALKELGFTEVDVEIKNVSASDEIFTMISFNKQRVKTCRELANENKYLKEIWGKRRGRKSEEEKLQNVNAVPVDTRKRISKEFGISAGNLSKIEYLDKFKPELFDAIDRGDISLNQAHTSIVRFEKERNTTKPQDILPTTITSENYTIYNESSANLSKLADQSIQTIFTSPPYWKLRTYSSDPNELGAEKISEEYVQRLVDHLQPCYRVLKSRGSFFLNLGDTYDKKCLQSIPHRVVIELVKRGWILRNTIVWHKKNSLPSNSKDSLSPSYEFIFHLTKTNKPNGYDYYPLSLPKLTTNKAVSIVNQKKRNNGNLILSHVSINGLKEGKQLSDFWTDDIVTTASANQSIVTKYEGSDHPAPFPSEICILPILQTSKPGDIVLDVFSGTSTVGYVALKYGRNYVGYELNPSHNEIQRGRLDDAVKEYNESPLPDELRQAA